MKVIVVPLLGAPAINPAYHYLAGNRAALPGMVFTMIVAGFAEETLFRGFLFERLGKLFGTGAAQEYPSSCSPLQLITIAFGANPPSSISSHPINILPLLFKYFSMR